MNVGWVERSDTHQSAVQNAIEKMMSIAAPQPLLQNWNHWNYWNH
jgi:hypothetical protein